jgi:hypothetical protein
MDSNINDIAPTEPLHITTIYSSYILETLHIDDFNNYTIIKSTNQTIFVI